MKWQVCKNKRRQYYAYTTRTLPENDVQMASHGYSRHMCKNMQTIKYKCSEGLNLEADMTESFVNVTAPTYLQEARKQFLMFFLIKKKNTFLTRLNAKFLKLFFVAHLE